MPNRSTASQKDLCRPFKVTYLVVFEEKDSDLAEGLVASTRKGGDATFAAKSKKPATGKIISATRDGSVVEIVVEGTRS